MKIFLGPAGIPTEAKVYDTAEGIRTVAKIGLNAMEVEFVQTVYLNKKQAEKIGEIAKENGVKLSIHAPYYINLNSADPKIITASRKRIFDCADRGERMGAEAIAIHAAYYGRSSEEETFETVKENFLQILDEMKLAGIKNVKLGVETMGKQSQFGSLEEVVKLHKEVKQVIPYIDWAHLFVRNNGDINYAEIFDVLEKLKLGKIHSHFEGVDKNKDGRFVDVHTPINSHPPFEPLAREILKRKIDITIISESPIIEKDSLKMKRVFEKLGHKFK